MRKGLTENGKSFAFRREISRNQVSVTHEVGWIWIREYEAKYFSNKNKIKMTLTTEDARNLVAAINELLPPEETEKSNAKPWSMNDSI